MYCKDCLSFGVCRYASGSRLLEKEPCADFMDIDTCVKLPCKVGTTVYYVYTHDEGEKILDVGKIISFSLERAFLWAYARYESGLCYWHTLSDFGRVLFLSREEAERSLKERESRR